MFSCLIINSCNPLPPTRVAVIFTDNNRNTTCDGAQPLFSCLENNVSVTLVNDPKIDEDTCLWRGTVDVEPPGKIKKYHLIIQFNGSEFGDTIVYIDTTNLENTISGVQYELIVTGPPAFPFGAKKIPLFSKRTSSWDTIYCWMTNSYY